MMMLGETLLTFKENFVRLDSITLDLTVGLHAEWLLTLLIAT